WPPKHTSAEPAEALPSFAPTFAKASVGRQSFSKGGKATEGYPPRIHRPTPKALADGCPRG
ncbi:MAG: hypothetical protein ACE5NA_08670, partial [Nitrospiraceae bacterium]